MAIQKVYKESNTYLDGSLGTRALVALGKEARQEALGLWRGRGGLLLGGSSGSRRDIDRFSLRSGFWSKLAGKVHWSCGGNLTSTGRLSRRLSGRLVGRLGSSLFLDLLWLDFFLLLLLGGRSNLLLLAKAEERLAFLLGSGRGAGLLSGSLGRLLLSGLGGFSGFRSSL